MRMRSIFALMAAVCIPSTGIAEPKVGVIIGSYVMCDHREDIVGINAAAKDAFDGAQQLYSKLEATKNDVGENTCAVGTYKLQATVVEALPDMVLPNGPNHAWVVTVVGDVSSHPFYYVLATELVVSVKPSSDMPPKGIGPNGNIFILEKVPWSVLDLFGI